MPAGRPREYDREAIYAAFEKYIAETDIPIIAEFSYKQGFGKATLYDWPEFSNLLNLCTAKKESALESKGLAGDVNTTMAIFSLKQLGWSDRNDLTLKGDKAHPIAISATDSQL